MGAGAVEGWRDSRSDGGIPFAKQRAGPSSAAAAGDDKLRVESTAAVPAPPLGLSRLPRWRKRVAKQTAEKAARRAAGSSSRTSRG